MQVLEADAVAPHDHEVQRPLVRDVVVGERGAVWPLDDEPEV
jgi:hypothetical protein